MKASIHCFETIAAETSDGAGQCAGLNRRSLASLARSSSLAWAVVISLAALPGAKGAEGDSAPTGADSAPTSTPHPADRSGTNALAWSAGGRVIPEELVQVNAKVAGEVIRVRAELGAKVKAGDLLAELDSTQYQLALDRSRAKLALAKARQSLARRLADQKVRDAEGLEVAEAEMKLAEIEFQWGQYDLGSTKIVAPIDGVILNKMAQVGMLADPKVAGGARLFDMADLRHLAVLVEVAGNNPVTQGQKCLIHCAEGRVSRSDSVSMCYGEVQNIGAALDPNTGTFPVRIRIGDAEKAHLKPGAIVRVDFLAPQ